MAAPHGLRLVGGAAAVAVVCLLAGFLAGRGALLATAGRAADPHVLDLVRTPSDQIERLLDSDLAPDTVVKIDDSEFRFQSDGRASVVEVLAARGETSLLELLASDWRQLDAGQVGAALCAAARYGHSGSLELLLQLPNADPESSLCRPEGMSPSHLARESGHGSASELLAKQGF